MRMFHKILIEYDKGVYAIHEAFSDIYKDTWNLAWVGANNLPKHIYKDIEVAQSVFEQMEKYHYEIPIRTWDSIEHLTDVVYYEDEEAPDDIEDVLEMFK